VDSGQIGFALNVRIPDYSWMPFKFFLAIIMAFALLSSYAAGRQEDQATSSSGQTENSEEHSAQEDVPDSSGPVEAAPTDSYNAPNSPPDTSNQDQYAEADLRAQRDMSRWTLIAAIAAAFSVGVSFVAVVLVWLTLEEARKTTKAAQATVDATRDIGEKQVRAYVSSGGFEIKALIGQSGEIQAVKFTPYIKNTGQSPASIQSLYSYIVCSDGEICPTVGFPLKDAICRDEIGAGQTFGLAGQVIPFDLVKKSALGQAVIYLLCYAAYRSVFNTEGEPDVIVFGFRVVVGGDPDSLTKDNLGAAIGFQSIADLRFGPAD
jgi:hypothetical protein